jgi:hypothetical protein
MGVRYDGMGVMLVRYDGVGLMMMRYDRGRALGVRYDLFFIDSPSSFLIRAPYFPTTHWP